jgi:hypothetical protein
MKIWPSGEDTDVMVKLVGCGPGLWVMLLKISWAWNMSNNPSNMPCYYVKKIYPLFHLAHPKYPYIVLKYPSKNGVFEM